MNTISRFISGALVALLGLWLIFFSLFFSEYKIDYGLLLFGLFCLLLGLFIFFNKKEDEIEEIKK